MIGPDGKYWSEDDVEFLKGDDSFGKLSYKFELQRYAPVWQEHTIGGDTASPHFDATVCGVEQNILLRAYLVGTTGNLIIQAAEAEGTSTTWDVVETMSGVERMSISSEMYPAAGATLYYYDGTSIYRRATADPYGEWGEPQLIDTVEDVVGIASPHTWVLHVLTRTAKGNFRFRHYFLADLIEWIWNIDESHITWPLPSRGANFDASPLAEPDYYPSARRSMVVLATDYVPLLGKTLEGLQLMWESSRVQGLATFRFDTKQWSDPYFFDVVDKVSRDARLFPRMTYYDGMTYMTYKRAFGTDFEDYYIACTQTADGVNWEMPMLLSNRVQAPAKLVFTSDHVYLLNSNSTVFADRTAYFGEPADSVCEDLTSNLLRYNSRVVQTRESSADLANVKNELRGDGRLLADKHAKQAVLEMGYYDGDTSRKGQVFLGDVQEASRTRLTPRDSLTLRLQGRLNLLNNIKSPGAHEWPSQQIGGDNHWDPTETGYGGLRYTAPESGRWTNSEDKEVYELYLRCDNDEGVAFSTLATDVFCGQVTGSIRLNETGHGEYAGICFWAQDRLHMWYAIYEADTDTISLVRRVANEDNTPVNTQMAVSGSMGWSAGVTYHLKVIMNFAIIEVYSSTDKQSWNLEIEYEIDHITSTVYDPNQSDHIPLIGGRVGYLGRGYTEESEYDPPYRPIPELPPPPDDPVAEDIVYVATKTGGVYYTEDFGHGLNHNPTWDSVSSGLSGLTLTCARLEPSNPYNVQYVMASGGEMYRRWYGGSWQRVLSQADIETLLGRTPASWPWSFEVNEHQEGHIYIPIRRSGTSWTERKFALIGSHDYGVSWSLISTLHGGLYSYQVSNLTIGISPSDPMYFAGCFGAGGSRHRIYRSLDGGYTWDLRGSLSIWLSQGYIKIAPFNSDTLFYRRDGSASYVSQDAGASWSMFFPHSGSLPLGNIFEENIYRALSGGKLYRTDDFGGDWSNVNDLQWGAGTMCDIGYDHDRLFLGMTSSVSVESPHIVFSTHDDGRNMQWKGGLSPEVPDTGGGNSIPYNCGGVCSGGIMPVWERGDE